MLFICILSDFGGGVVTRRHVRSRQEWHCLPGQELIYCCVFCVLLPAAGSYLHTQNIVHGDLVRAPVTWLQQCQLQSISQQQHHHYTRVSKGFIVQKQTRPSRCRLGHHQTDLAACSLWHAAKVALSWSLPPFTHLLVQ
jgi:hypothetical protein